MQFRTQLSTTRLGGLWEEFLVFVRRLHSNKNFGSKSQKKSSSDSFYIAEIEVFYLLALIYFFMQPKLLCFMLDFIVLHDAGPFIFILNFTRHSVNLDKITYGKMSLGKEIKLRYLPYFGNEIPVNWYLSHDPPPPHQSITYFLFFHVDTFPFPFFFPKRCLH